MRNYLNYWLFSHNLRLYQFTSRLEEPFDSKSVLVVPSRPRRFIGYDLTSPVKLFGREFAEDASRHRARFQASSAHSDRANWPGKEAELTCFVIFCYSNPELRTLPPELGNLRECWQLRLTKLTLPGIPKHVRPGELTTEYSYGKTCNKKLHFVSKHCCKTNSEVMLRV